MGRHIRGLFVNKHRIVRHSRFPFLVTMPPTLAPAPGHLANCDVKLAGKTFQKNYLLGKIEKTFLFPKLLLTRKA